MSETLVESKAAAVAAKWEKGQESIATESLKGRFNWTDLVYFLVLMAAAIYFLVEWPEAMDIYEKVILVCSTVAIVWVGLLWRPLRTYMIAAFVLSAFAALIYGDDLSRGDTNFFLKYFLSSQSAILWMCALYFMSTIVYWLAFVNKRVGWMGPAFAWSGTVLGSIGLLVRWRETHLVAFDMGHIPVSNLYEVFVLFCLITVLFYLYYERRYKTRALGGFVMLVVASAVTFLLWYTFLRDAATIQPLNNALNSWWMKLHVPANFVGYGTFALAAMVGFAYLVKLHGETTSWRPMIPLLLVGGALVAEPLIFSSRGDYALWFIYFGISVLIVAAILLGRKRISAGLPSFEVLDDIMYRAISIGFAFFTVATVLGAFWAADAWGTYWQWDPKETWAFIVWLNYAAWLHLRMMKGMRGQVMAYWALAGLVVTSFAFLGVNIFLSGLHSYGEL